jgi:hypothetical protein
MTLLKDVGRMSNLIGLGTLKTSALWSQPVDKILPLQIHAFIKRMELAGVKDQAETAVVLCMSELRRVVDTGQLVRPPMLDYSAPNDERMTSGELLQGLRFMGNPKASAVLFALETGMDAYAAGRLTWERATKMFQAATLTPLAIACTRVCPRQLRLQYVWWQVNEGGVAQPLLNLDADVFDAFGLIWGELAQRYQRLIMIDGDSDIRHLATVEGAAFLMLGLPAGRVAPPFGNPGVGPADSAG